MNERTKSRLITVAIIIALVMLWLWLRRIPAVQKAVQETANNLGLPDVGGLLPVDVLSPEFNGGELPGYVAHDYPLPSLSDIEDRYSPCNFCLQSRVTITTPSPPAKITPPAQPQVYPSYRSSMTWNQSPPPARPVQNWGPTGLPLGMGYMGGI